MKHFVFTFCLLVATASHASVTINFTFGPAYTAGGGSMVAANTIGVLVANTSGTGFAQGEDIIGSTLTAGQTLGGNRILGVVQAFDISEGGDFGFLDAISVSDLTGLTLGSSTGAGGTQLGFYWFPGLTTDGDTIAGGQSYGFFRSDTVDVNSGSEISFNMPTDGFSYELAALDTSLGGGYDPAQFQANSVAGVPEPSRMILAMLGFVGLMFRRRR